jgi:DNA-binding transcriptional LysR family regulator
VVTSEKTRVRLATPSGFSRIITPHLAAFQAQHPGVTLELLGGSRMLDLKRGEADVAIRQGPSEDEDLMTRKIGDVRWSLYASDAYLLRHPPPADPRQLGGHDLLGFEASLAGVPGARWIEEHGQGASVVMRARELSDLLAACAAGLGLAVLPAMAAALEPTLKRLTGEVLGTSKLWIVYRKEALIAEPTRAVIEFVAELMRDFLDTASVR